MKERPIPGTTGNNRPYLTIMYPDDSTVALVEVSCLFKGFPNALEDAARAKVEKYEPLRQELLQRHATVNILLFIVGSLGSWYPGNDRVLSTIHIGHRYANLMRRLCVLLAIAGLQNIWYQSICRTTGDPHPPRHWWTNPLRRVRTNPPWHLRTNPHRPLMTPQWMLHAEPLLTPAVSTSSTHIHSHLHTHTHTPIHSTHQTHTHRCTTWSNHP